MKNVLLLTCLLPLTLSADVFGIRPLMPITELQGFLREPISSGGWEIAPPVSNPLFRFYRVDVDARGRVAMIIALSRYYGNNADEQKKLRQDLQSLLARLVIKYGRFIEEGAQEPTADFKAVAAKDAFGVVWVEPHTRSIPKELSYVKVSFEPQRRQENRSFAITYVFSGAADSSADESMRGL